MRTRSTLGNFRRAVLSTVLAFVLALFPAAALHAASVLPMGFEALVDDAAIVFQGRCIENRSDRDANGMVVTYTTFQVEDPLKGSVGASHTIKQIGGRIGTFVSRIDGIPTFEPGRSYIVFLAGVSPAGFSSPIGLDQGRFEVVAVPGGHEVANGRDFRELLAPIPETVLPLTVRDKLRAKSGRVARLELNEFKQLVRERMAR